MPPNRAALAASLHQKPGEILKEPIEATQAATLLPGPRSTFAFKHSDAADFQRFPHAPI
jgi:hypothetical protein